MTYGMKAIEPTQRKAPRTQVPHTCPDGRMNEAAAANFLGVSTNTLRTWRSRGRGPSFVKIGRVWYYLDDLNVFIQSGYVDPTG